MEKNKSSFLGDTFIVFITQMSNVILMFLINILATKKFGAQYYGEYVYIVTLLNFLVIFCKFGMDQVAMAYLPKVEKDDNRAKSITGFIYIFTLLISIIITTITMMYYKIQGNSMNLLYIILVFSPIVTVIEVSSGIFRINNLVKTYVFNKNIIINILQVIIIVISDFLKLDGYKALFSTFVISYMISFALIIFHIVKDNLVKYINRRYVKDYKYILRSSFPLLLASLFAMMINRVDIIFIGKYLGSIDVAIYNAVVKIASLSLFLISVVNMTLMPMLSKLHHQGNRQEFEDTYKVTTKAVYLISIIFLGAIILFGKYGLALFEFRFTSAFMPLVIVSIANVCSAAIGVTGYINVIYGDSKIEMSNTFIAVVISILVNIILIPRMGVLGASISFLLSSLTLNGLRVFRTKRRYGLHPFDKEYIFFPIIYLGLILIIKSSINNCILLIGSYVAISIMILIYFTLRNRRLISSLIKSNNS